MINARNDYFSSWKSFIKNPILFSLALMSILVSAIIFSLLYLFIGTSGDSIILHYNVYFGVDLVGSWREVYLVPLVGFLFFVVNFVLAHYFFYKKERILSHLLMLTALMIQLGMAVASASIIMVNY